MTDRVIASRPSLEQVTVIVDFMERHPALALGQLRGLEGRDESKKLWLKLTRMVNNIAGPVRPMKSWIKYWADKKSTVRAKVQGNGGDSNSLTSNIEKRIWDLFLADDYGSKSPHGLMESAASKDSMKQETTFVDESFFNNDSMDQNHVDVDPVLGFDEPTTDVEDRQTAIMEKIVKVMSEQATALAQLAHATHVNAQAMERLADASQIQARAIDRLANTFETVSGAAHDVRNAIVDIDVAMKRFYPTSPT